MLENMYPEDRWRGLTLYTLNNDVCCVLIDEALEDEDYDEELFESIKAAVKAAA